MRTFRLRTTTAFLALAAGLLSAAPALAQEDGEQPQRQDDQQATGSLGSKDIIVTATKREEALSQVALPISAVSGEDLAAANANSLSDYINRLPGVVFNDYQPGISEVVIRGVSATTYHEQGQTTVGYYLNEIPLEEPGFPIALPDVDTFDLKRVEVLRGPQGTLFGSSTLGGLVNYVVNTADPSKIDAAAEGSVGSTKNASGDLNYAAKAMVNLPILQDRLAVRLMALQRVDAGYLDNPGIDEKGSNDFRTRGLRGSIVFTPVYGTKITYLSAYQDTDLDDQTYLDLDNPYIRDLPRAETQTTDFWLNSLRLDQEMGFATLTVLGSVDEKHNTTVLSYPTPYVTGNVTGDDAAYSLGNAHANIKTIEARLASADDGPVTWLIGASYMHSTKYSYDRILQNGASDYIDAHPGDFGGYPGSQLAPDDRLYGYVSDLLNEDLGIFGEVSFKPVPAFEITVGGRYYDTKAAGDVVNQAGALGPGDFTPADSSGSLSQTENGFTPKVTLAFRPTDTFMAYMTYSKGYRVGGINPNAGLLPSIEPGYDSDTVDNYEAGVKFSAFEQRLHIDATVFNIDWKDIQARLFGPAPSYFSYVTNAGSANIAGVEFSGTLDITRDLTFSSNATYQDAALTDRLPDNYGPGYPAGTPLPGSSSWSVSNNLTLDLHDMPREPTFAVAHRYLSKAPVAFGNPNMRGGFNVFDLRASIDLTDRFRLMGYVENVFDEYGILNAPFTSQATPAGSIIRPRTYGLRIDWHL
ncbi:TonB-dependent receptor [Stakelama saccharophila]|uniref:TonB-dependent receptor n=1 Tax=Stakelama saccharophila TaxID=3075605 RepID=A0ABZ0BAK2_9SPHN|nr:TonB-dependent receptor [Stakelama sp. W311]WNO54106.1 TonB-dependent receptor [Stakelama sp. W311]